MVCVHVCILATVVCIQCKNSTWGLEIGAEKLAPTERQSSKAWGRQGASFGRVGFATEQRDELIISNSKDFIFENARASSSLAVTQAGPSLTSSGIYLAHRGLEQGVSSRVGIPSIDTSRLAGCLAAEVVKRLDDKESG